jgi:PPE family protein
VNVTREDLDVTRWRGFSHAELYGLLHSGPGAAAAAVPAGRWAELAGTLHDINHDLAQAIGQAQALWTGGAANAAFAQLTDVSDWAGPAADSSARMQSSVEQQADHIGRARAAMPAPGAQPTPQPDPLVAPVVQLLSMQGDHEPLERASTDAARKAFEVMQTYQDDTLSTTDSLVSFGEAVDTAGHHHGRQRDQLSVRAFSERQETSAASAPVTVPRQFAEGGGRWSYGGMQTSQAGAGFVAPAPEVEVYRAAPLQAGSMAGMETGPIVSTPQRDTSSSSRRSSSGSGKLSGSLDLPPAAAAAPPTNSAAAMSPAAAPVSGSSADRIAPRRVDPLLSGFTEDAAEPVRQAARRRRDEEEKITESVEGAGSEVPPPVIGNGPYRQ